MLTRAHAPLATCQIMELDRPMRLTQSQLETHRAWRGFGAAVARHPPMRGWLAVPLHATGGRSVGVIQVTDRYEGDFTEADEAALVALARLASGALAGIRRSSRARRRADRTA